MTTVGTIDGMIGATTAVARPGRVTTTAARRGITTTPAARAEPRSAGAESDVSHAAARPAPIGAAALTAQDPRIASTEDPR